MILYIRMLAILISATITIEAHAARKPSVAFTNGAEVFVLKDATGKVPKFRILDDTPAERALAIAVITTLNSQTEVKPKLPVKDYVDLQIERLTFRPQATGQLAIEVGLSGHSLDLSKTVSKADFLSGKTIEVKFPPSDSALAFFVVQSGGNLRFRFDSARNELRIDEAIANMNFESPIAGSGAETIKFSGLGIRQPSR